MVIFTYCFFAHFAILMFIDSSDKYNIQIECCVYTYGMSCIPNHSIDCHSGHGWSKVLIVYHGKVDVLNTTLILVYVLGKWGIRVHIFGDK